MIVVLPVCAKDSDAALRNLTWIEHLDGRNSHTCIVSHDHNFDATAVLAAARRCFATVTAFTYPPPRSTAWPMGANWAWQRAAAHIRREIHQPWLWWEQDAVPLKRGWLDSIATAYAACGRPFMGTTHTTEHGPHLTGVAVYPSDVITRYPDMAMATIGPWDVTGGKTVLSRASISPLFQHVWSWDGSTNDALPPSFRRARDLDRLSPEAVLFHRCKDATLIEALRGKPLPNWKSYLKSNLALLKRTPNSNSRSTSTVKLVHVVERHACANDSRMARAVSSWSRLYRNGDLIPFEVWHYPRTTLDLGDKRDMPYVKDLLLLALQEARAPNDIVMLTNGDSLLHVDLPGVVRCALDEVQCVTSFRLNVRAPIDMTQPVEKLYPLGTSDLGRDLFAFRRKWLISHWNDIPDFVVGECEWDLVLALMIRKENGHAPTAKNDLKVPDDTSELPLGYLYHEMHERPWMQKDFFHSPAKRHNVDLANDWYIRHNLPDYTINFK